MLYRLSVQNLKRSIQDYSIYFTTLVVGIAVFYMYNTLDSQHALSFISSYSKGMLNAFGYVLNIISIFVAFIMGMMVVYTNRFFISRRKKEFGIYMTLGMGKKNIAFILIQETVILGAASVTAGILIGIFASQFLSILVSKLFQVKMESFQFVFSFPACIKTCIFFAVIYTAAVFFEILQLSNSRPIDSVNWSKKNERIRFDHPVYSMMIFLLGVVLLGYTYHNMRLGSPTISAVFDLMKLVIAGSAGTVCLFRSIFWFVGLMYRVFPSIYLRKTTPFVLGQMRHYMNTNVISMSMISVLLFVTIVAVSSSLEMNNSIGENANDYMLTDVSIVFSDQDDMTIEQALKDRDFDLKQLKDRVEVTVYTSEHLTWRDSLGDAYEEALKNHPEELYGIPEEIIHISDYNRLATLYDSSQYSLEDDEYLIVCNMDLQKEIRNSALTAERNTGIQVGSSYLKPKYQECKDGMIYPHVNIGSIGAIVIPDQVEPFEDSRITRIFAANYNCENEEAEEKLEQMFNDQDSELNRSLYQDQRDFYIETKSETAKDMIGLNAVIALIALYIGIIFLIASGAILSLKQITESIENKEQYRMLRRLGCDEKMINRTLFYQIASIFFIPLLAAMVHSIYGMQYLIHTIGLLANYEFSIVPVIVAVVLMGVIYSLYFGSTYFLCRRIIR